MYMFGYLWVHSTYQIAFLLFLWEVFSMCIYTVFSLSKQYSGHYSMPRVLYSGNGAIRHLITELGNAPLTLAELMVHYSPKTKEVEFCLHMKDSKWGRV